MEAIGSVEGMEGMEGMECMARVYDVYHSSLSLASIECITRVYHSRVWLESIAYRVYRDASRAHARAAQCV